jgi:hypothetical protein
MRAGVSEVQPTWNGSSLLIGKCATERTPAMLILSRREGSPGLLITRHSNIVNKGPFPLEQNDPVYSSQDSGFFAEDFRLAALEQHSESAGNIRAERPVYELIPAVGHFHACRLSR